MKYAASDVLYLHALRDKLNEMLTREGGMEMAQACFDFLPHRAELDLPAGRMWTFSPTETRTSIEGRS